LQIPCTKLRRTRGVYQGSLVELVVSNIGQANAAAATTAVILQRLLQGLPAPAAVISCGCSGAHSTELEKNDIVIGTDVKPVAQVKVLADGAVVQKGFRQTCQTPMVYSLPADPDLLAAARAAVAFLGLRPLALDSGTERNSPDRSGVGDQQSVAFAFGPVASSDVWVCEPTRLRQLHADFGTLCEEMEAAAVAQVGTRR
jgi:nucleoside phosphorylase